MDYPLRRKDPRRLEDLEGKPRILVGEGRHAGCGKRAVAHLLQRQGGQSQLQEFRVSGRRKDDARLELGHLHPHRIPRLGLAGKGYEAQVNNTHKDKRKTGSLYNIKDNEETVAKDHEWFHYHIKVDGKRIVITIDGKRIIDYTEPENAERPDNMKGRFLSSGTIAFQAHDPKSKTYFKNIQIKLLD